MPFLPNLKKSQRQPKVRHHRPAQPRKRKIALHKRDPRRRGR
jgi:hypothetical protein